FTELKAREATDGDFFANLTTEFRCQLFDRLVGVFYEALIKETYFRVPLLQLAFGNLFTDVLGLAGLGGLLYIELFFNCDYGRVKFFMGNGKGAGGADLEADIFAQILELFATGHEIGFAIDFGEYAHFAAHM